MSLSVEDYKKPLAFTRRTCEEYREEILSLKHKIASLEQDRVGFRDSTVQLLRLEVKHLRELLHTRDGGNAKPEL